jgi:hypothetical protein
VTQIDCIKIASRFGWHIYGAAELKLAGRMVYSRKEQ